MQIVSRLLFSALFSFSVSSAATLTNASITEFLANNSEGIVDEDGIADDWIEIQNTSGVSGDLGGWYLTDDPTNLTMWPLPATEVANGDYLVVFASGKDRSTTPHHTNFRLQSSAGGYLALVKPDGVTIATEFLNIPEQREDISYGAGFYLTPTPDAANNASLTGFVEDTSFSMDRGFYDAAISVEITTLTPAAFIRYTTDGTPPSSTQGTLYSGPITVDETTIIRAIAYKAGFQSTNIDTHTYVFPASVVTQPRMLTSVTQSATYAPQMIDSLKSVPTISIVADNPAAFLNETGPNITTESQTSVEMIYPDGTPGFQEDGGLSNFGGQHTNFNKKNFRVNFRSEWGAKKLKHPLFAGFDYPNFQPAEEFDVLNLRSGSHDMRRRGAYMSNRFTDDTMLEMGHIAPHGRFVHVYLNGQYWGQYHLRERWNADMASSYFGGSKDDYEAINANNSGRAFYTGEYNAGNSDGNIYDGSGVRVGASPHPCRRPRSLYQCHRPRRCHQCHRLHAHLDQWRFRKRVPGLRLPRKWRALQVLHQRRRWIPPHPNDAHHPVTHAGPMSIMTRMKADNDPDYDILLADRIHQHFFNDGAFTPAKNKARLQKRVDEADLGFISEAARWSNLTTDHRTYPSWQSYQNNLLNNHFTNLTASQLVKLKNAGMYPAINAPRLKPTWRIYPLRRGDHHDHQHHCHLLHHRWLRPSPLRRKLKPISHRGLF